ncbi:MAG: dephospho-CoA kinase [Muribaculaceae bacterium]|nr:dephospho-CoA kinase [Muribaculaceae bacterium]
MNRKVTIGIAGGIGAGKSIVSRLLRCNGMRVYDCDYEAKKIMTYDLDVKESIITKFGKGIYNDRGELHRKKLADLIFKDKNKRRIINSIVHKAVLDDIKLKRLEQEGLFFIETAIPSSGGIDKICDAMWIVESPLEVRFLRVENRDKMSREDFFLRIESQEKELENIETPEIDIIQNDDQHPMLSKILKQIDKYSLHNTYTISC